MINHYQDIIQQSERAIRVVVGKLTVTQAGAALDYVLKHSEWLLGLELVIDCLCEEDSTISSQQYGEFEKAYQLMDLVGDDRLRLLKSLVQDEA